MTLSMERRAALWGDRTAVIDGGTGETITYGDLARRSRALAERLRTVGIGEGDVVTVVSRNRPEVVDALFAARRIDAAFAPLSHRLTPATVTDAYETVDPDVVLHEAAQRDLVRAMDPDETCRFEELAEVEATPGDPAERGPEGTLLALPPGKGDASTVVEMPARQVEWNCVTAMVAWGLGAGDVAPVTRPLSSPDGLLRVALSLLYAGGTVVLDRAFDPADTLAVIEEGATCLAANAKEFHELAACEAFPDADLSSLSLALCGDRMGTDLRDEYRVHGVSPVRVYGRAEAGPNLLSVPRSREEADPDEVGRPLPDAEVRIVDESGAPVGAGEAGDLEATGPLTATGYRGGERFGEWVSTGDRARRDADGNVRLESGKGTEDGG